MHQKIEQHFVLIVLLLSIIALIYPPWFNFLKPFIPAGLGLVMFSIGMNTPLSSLTHTLARPKKIIGLVFIRYSIMPCIALFIASCLHLTKVETIGLLVLGTAPGGTAANVMAYLAGCNVALTVLLTFGTTLLSPLITPALIYLFLHQEIAIDFWSMVLHIATIIFIPIGAGLLLNRFKLPLIENVKQWMPATSIFLVALIIACIFSLNQTVVLKFPIRAMMAVLCLNGLGYGLGFLSAYLLKWDKNSILAVVFDYGMFDTAVAMVICTTFFSKETAVPAVLLTIIQNLTAPMIVRYLKTRKEMVATKNAPQEA